jgi:hypothetical protein
VGGRVVFGGTNFAAVRHIFKFSVKISWQTS